MKLSEAIRLGAMWSPQRAGGEMDSEGRCALAGACDALGIKPIRVMDSHRYVNEGELERRYPILKRHADMPPTCDMHTPYSRPVLHIIWSLNDTYGWTREQIADWVETIELQHEQEAAASLMPAAVLV